MSQKDLHGMTISSIVLDILFQAIEHTKSIIIIKSYRKILCNRYKRKINIHINIIFNTKR